MDIYLDIVQITLGIVQIGIIIWIAKNWKKQKRFEGYANRCNKILDHWYNITGYWYLLIGEEPYPINGESQIDYLKRRREEMKEAVHLFESVVREPDIYIDRNDQVSMDKIKKFSEKVNSIDPISLSLTEYDRSQNIRKRLQEAYYDNEGDITTDIIGNETFKRPKEEGSNDSVIRNRLYREYTKILRDEFGDLKRTLQDYSCYRK